jgi:hypothetical protein
MSGSRFSAQVREKIVVGSHVIGKSRAIEGWIGTVQKITGQALHKKFFIQWANHENHGENGEEFPHYPKRSFQLYSSRIHGSGERRMSARPSAPPPARFQENGAGDGRGASDEDLESDHNGSVTASSSSEGDGDDEDNGDDGVEGEEVVENVAGPSGDGPAMPNIIQRGPYDNGFTVTMERKCRGHVQDRTAWTVRNSIDENLHTSVHSAPTSFVWDVISKDPHSDKTEFDYWNLVVPSESLRQEVMLTNENIHAANQAAQAAPAGSPSPPIPRTSLGEIMRKHGLRLAMTLVDVEKPVSWFWSVESSSGCVTSPPSFGSRFGMSRNRFMQLEQYEQFCPQPADPSNDPWWQVRQLVSWFNARRAAIMKCGPFICEDESGSWWLGRDAEKLPEWLAFAAL